MDGTSILPEQKNASPIVAKRKIRPRGQNLRPQSAPISVTRLLRKNLNVESRRYGNTQWKLYSPQQPSAERSVVGNGSSKLLNLADESCLPTRPQPSTLVLNSSKKSTRQDYVQRPKSCNGKSYNFKNIAPNRAAIVKPNGSKSAKSPLDEQNSSYIRAEVDSKFSRMDCRHEDIADYDEREEQQSIQFVGEMRNNNNHEGYETLSSVCTSEREQLLARINVPISDNITSRLSPLEDSTATEMLTKWLKQIKVEERRFKSKLVLWDTMVNQAEVITSTWCSPNRLSICTAMGFLSSLQYSSAPYIPLLQIVLKQIERSIFVNFDDLQVSKHSEMDENFVKLFQHGKTYFDAFGLAKKEIESLSTQVKELQVQCSTYEETLDNMKSNEAMKLLRKFQSSFSLAETQRRKSILQRQKSARKSFIHFDENGDIEMDDDIEDSGAGQRKQNRIFMAEDEVREFLRRIPFENALKLVLEVLKTHLNGQTGTMFFGALMDETSNDTRAAVIRNMGKWMTDIEKENFVRRFIRKEKLYELSNATFQDFVESTMKVMNITPEIKAKRLSKRASTARVLKQDEEDQEVMNSNQDRVLARIQEVMAFVQQCEREASALEELPPPQNVSKRVDRPPKISPKKHSGANKQLNDVNHLSSVEEKEKQHNTTNGSAGSQVTETNYTTAYQQAELLKARIQQLMRVSQGKPVALSTTEVDEHSTTEGKGSSEDGDRIVEQCVDECSLSTGKESEEDKASKKKKKRKKKTLVALQSVRGRVLSHTEICTMLANLIQERLLQEGMESKKASSNASSVSHGACNLQIFMKHYLIRSFGLKSLAMSNLTALEVGISKFRQSNRRIQMISWLLGNSTPSKGSEIAQAYLLSCQEAFEFFLEMIRSIMHISAPPSYKKLADNEFITQGWKDFIGDGATENHQKSIQGQMHRQQSVSPSTPLTTRHTISYYRALDVCKCIFNQENQRDRVSERIRRAAILGGVGGGTIDTETLMYTCLSYWYEEFHLLLEDLREHFKLADQNEDGIMDYHEFRDFVLKYDPSLSDMELVSMYSSCAGEDNSIDESEFIAFILHRRQRIKANHDPKQPSSDGGMPTISLEALKRPRTRSNPSSDGTPISDTSSSIQSTTPNIQRESFNDETQKRESVISSQRDPNEPDKADKGAHVDPRISSILSRGILGKKDNP